MAPEYFQQNVVYLRLGLLNPLILHQPDQQLGASC